VLDRTDVLEDGSARARRHLRGLVGRDGRVPGAAARGLRLRASADALLHDALGHADPRFTAVDRNARSAGSNRGSLSGAAAPTLRIALARWIVRRLRRTSLLRAVGERATVAGMDGAERARERYQSLFSLSRVQSRFLRRTPRLSFPDRAAARTRRSIALVEPSLRSTPRGHGRVRICGVALE